MAEPPVTQVESEIYRGLRVKVDRIVYHPNMWQPFLEIRLAVQSMRYVPIRIRGSELYISYQKEEVGPLPPLPMPYELRELGKNIEIRIRKDLYPTLHEDLKYHQFSEREFQIRGNLVIEAPGYHGILKILVDTAYRLKL
jgi:hypothetical protein